MDCPEKMEIGLKVVTSISADALIMNVGYGGDL